MGHAAEHHHTSPVVKVDTSDLPVEIGKQGQRLIRVIHTANTGSQSLSGGIITMAPGKIADVHLHEESDLILVIIRGHGITLHGDNMDPVHHGPESWMLIKKGEPHTGINPHPTEDLVAYEFRTDPTFHEDVTVLPHLQDLAIARAAELKDDFAMSLAAQ